VNAANCNQNCNHRRPKTRLAATLTGCLPEGLARRVLWALQFTGTRGRQRLSELDATAWQRPHPGAADRIRDYSLIVPDLRAWHLRPPSSRRGGAYPRNCHFQGNDSCGRGLANASRPTPLALPINPIAA